MPSSSSSSSPVASGRRTRRRAWVIRFLPLAISLALVIITLGWITDVRTVAYGGLLAAASVAFLPLIIVLAGLAIIVLTTLLAAVASLFGAGDSTELVSGAEIVGVGAEHTASYYRAWSRAKSPWLWGSVAGVLLGLIVLAGLIVWIVLPKEARSAQIMLGTQKQIERIYEETKRYPVPDAEGHLPNQQLYPGVNKAQGVVRDGFGRPMRYSVDQSWRVGAYRLMALGFDGVPGGGDDLCVTGETNLNALSRSAKALWQSAKDLTELKLDFRGSLEATRTLRCD